MVVRTGRSILPMPGGTFGGGSHKGDPLALTLRSNTGRVTLNAGSASLNA